MNLKDLLFTDVKELRKQKREEAEAPEVEAMKAEEPKTEQPEAQEPKAEPGDLAVPEFVETASKSRRPGLKMPKVRAPRFNKPQFKGRQITMPPTVTGAVENLRERGLLPVAIVLVAAILAVPFLLSGGSSSPPPPKAEPSAAAAADAIQTQQAVVLANNPGVREYKKRLDGSAKDPFVQQYKVPESGGGTAATGVQQVGGGTGSVEPTAAATGSPSDTSSTPAGSSAQGGLYHYGADLYVGAAGKKNPKLWRNVKRTTSLPNKNVKVAAFIGVPIDKPKVATFLVSSDVVNIAGKGNCTLGDDGCELISVKVGDQIKLTAANGVTYAIKVADTFIVHDKSP